MISTKARARLRQVPQWKNTGVVASSPSGTQSSSWLGGSAHNSVPTSLSVGRGSVSLRGSFNLARKASKKKTDYCCTIWYPELHKEHTPAGCSLQLLRDLRLVSRHARIRTPTVKFFGVFAFMFRDDGLAMHPPPPRYTLRAGASTLFHQSYPPHLCNSLAYCRYRARLFLTPP